MRAAHDASLKHPGGEVFAPRFFSTLKTLYGRETVFGVFSPPKPPPTTTSPRPRPAATPAPRHSARTTADTPSSAYFCVPPKTRAWRGLYKKCNPVFIFIFIFIQLDASCIILIHTGCDTHRRPRDDVTQARYVKHLRHAGLMRHASSAQGCCIMYVVTQA